MESLIGGLDQFSSAIAIFFFLEERMGTKLSLHSI